MIGNGRVRNEVMIGSNRKYLIVGGTRAFLRAYLKPYWIKKHTKNYIWDVFTHIVPLTNFMVIARFSVFTEMKWSTSSCPSPIWCAYFIRRVKKFLGQHHPTDPVLSRIQFLFLVFQVQIFVYVKFVCKNIFIACYCKEMVIVFFSLGRVCFCHLSKYRESIYEEQV